MKMLPSLAGALSGSIGGLTASRNRGGPYFRRRATPTNPNSAHQQAARSALGSLVQRWTGLTPEQQNGWKVYAQNTPRTDVLGQALVLTGQQAYIGSNQAKVQAVALGITNATPGLFDIVDDAPVTFDTGPAISSVLTFSVDAVAHELTPLFNLSTAAPVDGAMFLFISRAVNNSVNYFKGPFSMATGLLLNEGNTQNDDVVITMTDATKWTWPNTSDPLDLTVGAIYFLRAVMSYTDGRYSQPWIGKVEVTATPP